MRKKNVTIIVIRDKRKLLSVQISSVALMILFSLSIGFGIVFLIASFPVVRTMLKENEEVRNTALIHKANTETVIHSSPHGNVAIENFKTHYNTQKKLLTYQFLLKNKKDDGTTSAGYLFVTLKSALLTPDKWVTYPSATLRDGVPQYYREGDPFMISKYKLITHNVPVRYKYDTATILVFSERGDLLLRENVNFPSPITPMAGN